MRRGEEWKLTLNIWSKVMLDFYSFYDEESTKGGAGNITRGKNSAASAKDTPTLNYTKKHCASSRQPFLSKNPGPTQITARASTTMEPMTIFPRILAMHSDASGLHPIFHFSKQACSLSLLIPNPSPAYWCLSFLFLFNLQLILTDFSGNCTRFYYQVGFHSFSNSENSSKPKSFLSVLKSFHLSIFPCPSLCPHSWSAALCT